MSHLGTYSNVVEVTNEESLNCSEKLQLLLIKSYSTFNLLWKLLWSWIVFICSSKTWDMKNMYNFLYPKTRNGIGFYFKLWKISINSQF